MKFPNVFQGALAASAPIRHFKGTVDPMNFTNIVDQVLKVKGSEECYEYIHNGFFDLKNLKYDPMKYGELKYHFNLC